MSSLHTVMRSAHDQSLDDGDDFALSTQQVHKLTRQRLRICMRQEKSVGLLVRLYRDLGDLLMEASGGRKAGWRWVWNDSFYGGVDPAAVVQDRQPLSDYK